MSQFKLLIVCLLCPSVYVVAVNGQEASVGKLIIEPYSFRTYNGKEFPAELEPTNEFYGFSTVSKMIQVIGFRAAKNQRRNEPVF